MFYVYEWYNKNTNEIFYVGKGCRNRYKQVKSRNKLFKNYYENHSCDVRIIKIFELEQDAFDYEHERIVELKQQNQCSCNLDDGGAGGVNFVWTPEMRQYMSQYNPMKRQDQKKRMSQNNPMKNPEIAKKAGMKHARAVIINGVRYESVREAAKKYNVTDVAVSYWCRQGKNSKGQLCKYENEKQVILTTKRGKPIMYQNKFYYNAVELAAQVHKSTSTISSWCKKGFDSKGNECRFATQEQIQKYKE